MRIKIDSPVELTYFGISYNLGGSWEKPGNRGISHLMEHLGCRTYRHLESPMRALGIDNNASTSDNRVIFYNSGVSGHTEEISQEMLDCLVNGKNVWTKEEFENEKSTVLQEYSDTFSEPLSNNYENFLRKYYGYYGPIGLKNDIENFSYDDSIEFLEKFSKPEMICSVRDHNINFNKEYDVKKPLNQYDFGDHHAIFENCIESDNITLGMIHKFPGFIENAPMMSLILQCMSHGLESPLYDELREKQGLVYAIHAFERAIGGSLVPTFLMQSMKSNESKLIESVEKFFSTDMSEKISPERFNTCKQYKMMEKRKIDILPHSGVSRTIMTDTNEFDGLESISYESLIQYANDAFSMENFEIAVK